MCLNPFCCGCPFDKMSFPWRPQAQCPPPSLTHPARSRSRSVTQSTSPSMVTSATSATSSSLASSKNSDVNMVNMGGETPSVDLNTFQLEKKIGKGQFSEVFSAIDTRTGERIALKKIAIFEMMDAKSRLDCMKEINLLQQLDHPNVIKHLGSFVHGTDLYIVLELAGGGDLSKLIRYYVNKKCLMQEHTIWKYFGQIAEALKHMHEKRVMHRDIKPANVFVTVDGIPKLGDLGLGRFFSSVTHDARSLVGTPYYMSPERIKEESYDFKSDIWSMGCLLYELAALQSPFYGERMNLFSLCKKIETCNYPPLPSDTYSAQLRNMVADCLNPDPELRPDTRTICKVARSINSRYERARRRQEGQQ